MITMGNAMKALGSLAVILILSGWSVQASSAEEACAEDIARFCNDSSSDQGNVALCLKRHEDELSSLCRDMLQAVQKRIDEVKQACTMDIDRLCKGIEPGRGRIAECLNGHTSELTPACAEQMKWLNSRMNEK
jgi:Golgi apparatus protein 1